MLWESSARHVYAHVISLSTITKPRTAINTIPLFYPLQCQVSAQVTIIRYVCTD